jgi:hypothetical protein
VIQQYGKKTFSHRAEPGSQRRERENGGGFGSAWVETTVSVKRLDWTVNRGKPFDVLSDPGAVISKAYVLSDQNADTDLQLTWSAPTHLQIYHRSDASPDLEVVRFADIDISFRQGSSQP